MIDVDELKREGETVVEDVTEHNVEDVRERVRDITKSLPAKRTVSEFAVGDKLILKVR